MTNVNWNQLAGVLPQPPQWKIRWEKLDTTPLLPWIARMQQTPQNPHWHGEGNVWTHTRMVCQVLADHPDFRTLPDTQREIVFLAALLHDIGKVPATRLTDGVWTSPGHARAGAKIARSLLWREFGLSGTGPLQTKREAICTLIRYHALLPHLLDRDDPERQLTRTAAQGEFCPDFSLSLLKLLTDADILGRTAPDIQELLDEVSLSFSLAEELDICHHPLVFASPVTAFAYLSGRNVSPEQQLYDDTWGEVILMAGLPGTGKDSWIQAHCPQLPVVSMDEIRIRTGISPVGPQEEVVRLASEMAKEYFRQKQSFVWNATSISQSLRQNQLNLFHRYHARVRICYLETDWETGLARNRSREARVPPSTIERMLDSLEPPERWEAQTVEWHCV